MENFLPNISWKKFLAENESSNGTLEKKEEIILNSGNDEPIGDGMSTILRRPRDQQQPMTNGSTSQKWDIEVHSNPVVDEQVKVSYWVWILEYWVLNWVLIIWVF